MGKKPGRRSPKRQPRQLPSPVSAVFPTQANSDPDNPREFARWAFNGMPHMRGAPLGFPPWYLEELSQRLWDIGFRFHPELQTIKYVVPTAEQEGPGLLHSAGRWIGIDEAVDELPSFADQLTTDQKALVAKMFGIDASVLGAVDPGPEKVPYTRADGTQVMVSPAQARSWANAKKARDER